MLTLEEIVPTLRSKLSCCPWCGSPSLFSKLELDNASYPGGKMLLVQGCCTNPQCRCTVQADSTSPEELLMKVERDFDLRVAERLMGKTDEEHSDESTLREIK